MPVEVLDVMPKDKPAHEVRLGLIKAAVWKNDTENGVRYNTTFSRLYKDGEDWKNTSSFSRDDLLVVQQVCQRVFSWIHEQDQEKENGEQEGRRSTKK
jgi:hypothetical protein